MRRGGELAHTGAFPAGQHILRVGSLVAVMLLAVGCGGSSRSCQTSEECAPGVCVDRMCLDPGSNDASLDQNTADVANDGAGDASIDVNTDAVSDGSDASDSAFDVSLDGTADTSDGAFDAPDGGTDASDGASDTSDSSDGGDGACSPGFADCDGNAGNGCETDLSSASDCGACDNACSGSVLCFDARVCADHATPTKVVTGSGFSCALLESGMVRCWGRGDLGQLGQTSAASSATPVSVVRVTTAIDLAAGSFHACIVQADHQVACWGYNDKGQIGAGGVAIGSSTSGAEVVTGLSGAVTVTAGASHSCVVRDDGTVACWGRGSSGQNGSPTYADGAAFVNVGFNVGTVLTAVSAGAEHTCALDTDGNVWCWGRGLDGQLGATGVGNVYTPRKVSSLATVSSAVAAGGNTSCAITTSDRLVFCWGSDQSGKLGNGSTDTDTPSPSAVLSLDQVPVVSIGEAHACAIEGTVGVDTGTVWCWGEGADGRLGDGSGSGFTAPNVSTGLANAVSVSAGVTHSCAVLDDGAVYCWGDNTFGGVGNGSMGADITTPARVVGL